MDLINIKLDRDSFGILADFLSDDLQFLLFLKLNDIKPKGKDIEWENLKWNEITYEQDLSMEFIQEFQTFLDWNILTRQHKKSMDFIRTFPELIDWNIISSSMIFDNTFSYEFFEEFQDKFNWTKISRWDYIAEDFIDKFKDNLNWDVLSSCQGLSQYLCARYSDRINWDRVRLNRSFNRDFIEQFEPRPEVVIDIEPNNDVVIRVDNLLNDIQNDELPNDSLFETDSDGDVEIVIDQP